ncbi:MAG TPA: radical SAM family heme chaperone HemW [Terriglobales bacterium]|nr:radical SAM family heme chaperone HemW [Terriglobales bacterium]
MPLGLYISVPFCRTKCSYCNFASDVLSRVIFDRYIARTCSDIAHASENAREMGGRYERAVDSIYLGGGTPTILDIAQLERLFVTISQNFAVASNAEITVECAPGTLTTSTIDAFRRCAVNRVSLGVQSFVDTEAASVGRLHNRATVLEDLARLRAAGMENINIDLIAGLPHQTPESWDFSLNQAIAAHAPHLSVYMLEIDGDSRLGRELIAGGTRYHAHFVPNEEVTATLYETAWRRLEAVGVKQYEISNFARAGHQSRHNLKYWTRQPYLGFGVDAHSMLPAAGSEHEAVRFSSADALEDYVAGAALKRAPVSPLEAVEETFFLGLRLNSGVDLQKADERFGSDAMRPFLAPIAEMLGQGLLAGQGSLIWLTPRGRLLSNEVFERFILTTEHVG